MDVHGYVVLGVNDRVSWLDEIKGYVIDCPVHSCLGSCCGLKVDGKARNGRVCESLDGYLCNDYKSRPLACRIYPFGVFYERIEGKEAYFSVALLSHCDCLKSVNGSLADTLNQDLISSARMIVKPVLH